MKDEEKINLSNILGEVIAELKGIKAAVDEHVEDQAEDEQGMLFNPLDAFGRDYDSVHISSEEICKSYLKLKKESNNKWWADEEVDVNSEEYKIAYNRNYKLISDVLAPFVGQKISDVKPEIKAAISSLWSDAGNPVDDINDCIEDMKNNTGCKGIVTPFKSVDEYRDFFERRGDEIENK